MNVSDLVATLESGGIVLSVSGCKLQLTAQPGSVSAEKLEQVRQHKQAIITFLGDQFTPAVPHTVERHDLNVETASSDERGWTVRKNATHFVYEALGCPDYDTIDWDSSPTKKRLIGCGFPARATKIPSARILADSIIICPRCNQCLVLPELVTTTGGMCWECHTSESVETAAPRTANSN